MITKNAYREPLKKRNGRRSSGLEGHQNRQMIGRQVVLFYILAEYAEMSLGLYGEVLPKYS